MSFPDPTHPSDSPESEVSRIDLAPGPAAPRLSQRSDRRRGRRRRRTPTLADLVRRHPGVDSEAPADGFRPHSPPTRVGERSMPAIRIESSSYDEAVGRVVTRSADGDGTTTSTCSSPPTTVNCKANSVYLFKGPCHVDALMRLALVWRPAPSMPQPPAVVTKPVGLVRPGPFFLRHRRGHSARVDGGSAPAHRRLRRRGAWVRAGPDRVGQRSVRHERPVCDSSCGIGGCAPPTSREPPTTGPKGSCADLMR